MVEQEDKELRQEVKKLNEDLIKTKKELKDAQRDVKPMRYSMRPIEEVTCYGCGEKGHKKLSSQPVVQPGKWSWWLHQQ